jgi:hypothetical protein
MELIQDKNSRSGVIGTILVHLLLLLLFIQFGMPYQDPPPENEGAMMINFGDSDEGSGEEEPEELASSTSEKVIENNATEEPVMTQDNVEAVAVNSSENQETETESQEEPVVSENLQNALNAANNAQNNPNDVNQGETGNPGNQGDPDGDPNSHGNSFSNGIGFNLGGRGKVSFKKPDNPTQEDGKVVVDIVVDKYGKVIKATPGARGSTTTNPILYKKAREAALKAKFTTKLEAPTDQKGTMTFVFILN